MNKENNTDKSILKHIEKGNKVIKKKLITEYYNKLCYDNKYYQNKLFVCFILSASLSISAMFSIMKVSLSYRDERIVEIQNQLESCKNKVQSISATIDSLANDLDSIKNDVKNSKESSSNGLVRLAGLLKDIQNIKNVLNLSNDQQTNSKEENLNDLPSDKREFIETLENLVKDGVPFSNVVEKIDKSKYTTINNLLKFKDTNVKSIESLKKDFSAISASAFGNNKKESFWQKQFRIFKEKISDAVRIESSSDKIQNLGNSLDDKVLFEKAQSYINNSKVNEAYELLSKIKSNNKDIVTLKSDLLQRAELDKVFKHFKQEFIEKEARN